MTPIPRDKVQAFIEGCRKHEPECLDSVGFAPCVWCAGLLLEIAAEVLHDAKSPEDPEQ